MLNRRLACSLILPIVSHCLILSALSPACSSLLSVLQSLDLTGDREFLTREGAEEALAPMLVSGSQTAKVGIAGQHGAGVEYHVPGQLSWGVAQAPDRDNLEAHICPVRNDRIQQAFYMVGNGGWWGGGGVQGQN